ncbi:MAG: hypothetical protein LBV09_05865 [Deferribacteraceae bacterium]|jgi:predicted transcriptional regulator|nr:hypothetical protein [Deferribacteraceae bacterium]
MPKQMQTISTRFTADTIARLEEIATKQDKTRSELIQGAVEGYLNSLAWLEAKVKRAEEGTFISHDEMKAKLQKLGVKCA